MQTNREFQHLRYLVIGDPEREFRRQLRRERPWKALLGTIAGRLLVTISVLAVAAWLSGLGRGR